MRVGQGDGKIHAMQEFINVTHRSVQQLRTLAREFLAPRAQEADRGTTPPVDQIRRLAREGLLGLTAPARFGGADASSEIFRDSMAAVASGCGVTAFCYLQHVSGVRRISECESETLKEACLRDFAKGERFLSLAHSHLRRPGPPAVRVKADHGRYIFDGTAPWMTGWGLATDVLLAGTLPDGRSVWVVAPLGAPGVSATEPMALCAMNASATVSLILKEVQIDADLAIGTWTPEEVAEQSVSSVLTFSSLSLGVCLAALDYLYKIDGNDHVQNVARALHAEATRLQAAVNESVPRIENLAHVAKVRAQSIDLGIRAAHAAVVATGGTANGLDHLAQRLFREAMLYSLTAQTQDLRETSLDLIASRALEIRPG
jgi:alkylation response protein AidB-like acyl-CoA dehydrogenase